MFIHASTDNTPLNTLSIVTLRHISHHQYHQFKIEYAFTIFCYWHQDLSKKTSSASRIFATISLRIMSTSLDSKTGQSAGPTNKSAKSNDSNSNLNVRLLQTPCNMSSRTNSVASSARLKIKPPSVKDSALFEDPRYKAKQLKKQRRHDIQKRFNEVPGMGNPNSASKNVAKYSFEHNSDYLKSEYKVAHCHMTFIFDPNGRLSYWMGEII